MSSHLLMLSLEPEPHQVLNEKKNPYRNLKSHLHAPFNEEKLIPLMAEAK